jgi:RAT1-interacting protein
MIMSTPYEFREPWIILATRYKGTIYLCNEETAKEKGRRMNRTDRDKKFLRYGFKFERYIFSDHPSKPPPGNSEPVIESEELCMMFGTEIDGKRILYGAEVDGVISNEEVKTIDDLRKCPLAEVKVKRREANDYQLKNFYKFKARNWWLQSFLVGIDTIHYGVRTDDGIVEDVEEVKLKELSDEAKQNNYWHGTVAMNFLNDFLKKVSRDMKNIDNPNIVFRYYFDSERSDYVAHREVEGHRFRFLDDEFVEFMNNLR